MISSKIVHLTITCTIKTTAQQTEIICMMTADLNLIQMHMYVGNVELRKQILRTRHHIPPLLPLPRQSRCQPPRSPSPERQDLPVLQRTPLLPFLLRHTSGQRHALSTSDQTCGRYERTPQQSLCCC